VARSRRKAREAGLRALYEVEIGKLPAETVLTDTLEAAQLPPEIAAYAERLVNGVLENKADLDQRISSLILDYDYDRIAVVDRNVMRIAAFELFHEPAIPPAVILNEAIEIAKKYSTAESGKFVNGVLGRLLQDSPKANWDPATAPKEEPEEIFHEPEPEVEEVTIDADSDEAKKLSRIGGWKLRAEDPS
jgi:transcription antitermination protein NusB